MNGQTTGPCSWQEAASPKEQDLYAKLNSDFADAGARRYMRSSTVTLGLQIYGLHLSWWPRVSHLQPRVHCSDLLPVLHSCSKGLLGPLLADNTAQNSLGAAFGKARLLWTVPADA